MAHLFKCWNISPHRQEVEFAVRCTPGLKDECDARKFTPFTVFGHGWRQPVETKSVKFLYDFQQLYYTDV